MARPRIHGLTALLAVVALRDRLTWAERLAVLAGGVLVDADHLVDYGLRRWAPARAWLVLPLHGWEYVAGLALLARQRRRGFAGALALGLALHLTIDHLTNRPDHPALYSVLFRLYNGFSGARLRFRTGDGRWMGQPWWQWF